MWPVLQIKNPGKYPDDGFTSFAAGSLEQCHSYPPLDPYMYSSFSAILAECLPINGLGSDDSYHFVSFHITPFEF